MHAEVFADSLGVRLGPLYINALLSFFIKSPGAIFLLGESSEPNVAIGYAFGISIELLARLNRALLAPAVRSLCVRPQLILLPAMRKTLLHRARAMARTRGRRAEDPLAPPTFSLVAIGVRPEARARGCGSALIDGFEAQARARAFASVRLSVRRDNAVARRLYERMGWFHFAHPDPRLLHYGKRLKGIP
jgi:GNAT superfamily N-acetyltransferase